jgi:WD40 repeat protein
VWSVAFSPDGRILAAGSNGSIALWDVATRTRVGPLLVGHHGDVRDVAFSSDGRLLASVGLYGDLALWDVQSQQRIGPAFTWHAGAAQGVAFSPGDDFLATAGDRPAVTLVRTGVPWKASAPDLEARACAVAARNLSVDEWQAFVGDAERAQPACPNAPVRQPAAASAASSSS